MPVRGDVVLPSGDSDIDPAALAVAIEYLASQGLYIEGRPLRKRWTPSHLARDLGGTARTWQRRCEDGQIRATRDGREYVVIFPWLVRYYADGANVSAN